jgi:hypothetical protein
VALVRESALKCDLCDRDSPMLSQSLLSPLNSLLHQILVGCESSRLLKQFDEIVAAHTHGAGQVRKPNILIEMRLNKFLNLIKLIGRKSYFSYSELTVDAHLVVGLSMTVMIAIAAALTP